jgi:putative permease
MPRSRGRYDGASSAYLETVKVSALLIALFLASFYLLSSVLLPVIISFTLYTLSLPFVNYLVRKDVNRSAAIIIMLIIMMSLSIFAISFALPQFLQQAAILKNKLPAMIGQFETFTSHYSAMLGQSLGIEINTTQIMGSVLAQSSSIGKNLLGGITEQIFAITLAMILVPVMTYFILKDFKSLRNNLLNWLPNSSFELGWLIYHRVSRQLEAYTRGVMLQSFIIAVVASIGFVLIGLDMPVLLGSLTGLLNLVPYVGPLIAMFLSVLVAAAMTPFDANMIYLAIGVIVAAQLVDNLVVIPAFIANVVDLHPVLVIVGIIIFGNLFGAIGVILAIPSLATIKIIYRNIYADIHNDSRQTSA